MHHVNATEAEPAPTLEPVPPELAPTLEPAPPELEPPEPAPTEPFEDASSSPPNLTSNMASKAAFLALSQNTDGWCISVDEQIGLWAQCRCPYGCVVSRKGHPFTLACWNQHVNENEQHKQAVAEQNETNRIAAMMKSRDPKLTKKDRGNYARMSKKPTQITSSLPVNQDITKSYTSRST